MQEELSQAVFFKLFTQYKTEANKPLPSLFLAHAVADPFTENDRQGCNRLPACVCLFFVTILIIFSVSALDSGAVNACCSIICTCLSMSSSVNL